MIGGRLQAGRLPTATTRQLLTSPALKGIIVRGGGERLERKRERQVGLFKTRSDEERRGRAADARARLGCTPLELG